MPQAGASLVEADERSETPLHYAAFFQHMGVVRVLLQPFNGAAANLRDTDDITPLHWAASQGGADIVAVLLAASPRHINQLDRVERATPLDYAHTAQVQRPGEFNPAVLELLQQAGVSAPHPRLPILALTRFCTGHERG